MNQEQKLQRAKDLLSGSLKPYIGVSQRSAIAVTLRGEERYGFADMLIELWERIEKMPVTYQTDGQGKDAIVYLHYFKGGADRWFTELDKEREDAWKDDDYDQSFGYASFYGPSSSEAGYISIKETVEVLELDLYWTPKPMKDVK